LVGFNYFNSKKVEAAVKDKNTNIIVYCSIGVRSEQIGEKLKKLGYKTFITSTAVFLNIKIAEGKWSTTKIK
jgi:rhodanese-related sulfurtransferase